MEYFSAKQWSTYCTRDEPWKHYAEGKKPDAKGHVLYDSIYMNCPEEVNS